MLFVQRRDDKGIARCVCSCADRRDYWGGLFENFQYVHVDAVASEKFGIHFAAQADFCLRGDDAGSEDFVIYFHGHFTGGILKNIFVLADSFHHMSFQNCGGIVARVEGLFHCLSYSAGRADKTAACASSRETRHGGLRQQQDSQTGEPDCFHGVSC